MDKIVFSIVFFSIFLVSCSSSLFEDKSLVQFDPAPIKSDSNTIQCQFTHMFMGGYTRGLYNQTLFDGFTNWLYEVTHKSEDKEKYYNKEFEERFLEASFSKCPATDSGCKIEFQDLNTKSPKMHGNLGEENYTVLNRSDDTITLLNADAAMGIRYPIIVYQISFVDGTVIQTKITGDAIRYSTTYLGRCF